MPDTQVWGCVCVCVCVCLPGVCVLLLDVRIPCVCVCVSVCVYMFDNQMCACDYQVCVYVCAYIRIPIICVTPITAESIIVSNNYRMHNA